MRTAQWESGVFYTGIVLLEKRDVTYQWSVNG